MADWEKEKKNSKQTQVLKANILYVFFLYIYYFSLHRL